MSQRRSSLLTKYCTRSPALRRLTNSTGVKSSGGAITPKTKTRKPKRKKVKSAPRGPRPALPGATNSAGTEARAMTVCPDCQCRLRVNRLEGHRTRCPKFRAASQPSARSRPPDQPQPADQVPPQAAGAEPAKRLPPQQPGPPQSRRQKQRRSGQSRPVSDPLMPWNSEYNMPEFDAS
jgi:hypothetical protein